MKRARFGACLVILAGGACAGARGDPAGFSPDAVDQAIKKGAEHLWSLQNDDGGWPPLAGKNYPVGPTALITYALLETGADPLDPRMAKALKWLRTHKTRKTYALGARCHVWRLANKKTNNRYLRALGKDVTRLIKAAGQGCYTYDSPPTGTRRAWDNSNSQFGLLGVWAGLQANMNLGSARMKAYFRKVARHWIDCQCEDGGWAYHKVARGKPSEGTESMTAAGLASLFVCLDNTFDEAYAEGKVPSLAEPLERGMKWFETNLTRTISAQPDGYYLFSVERVGRASGYKYFKTTDWYKMGATGLLASQQPTGAFSVHDLSGSEAVATAFGVLFLARGRQPVLFNKLEREGDWRNRPRDLANVTRWVSDTFEKTVNWQIINLEVPVAEWHDAPILYLSGSKAPVFSAGEMDKLRRFVWQGGTIFSCTELNGEEFRKGMREVYEKLFPDYEMQKLDASHPIYSAHFRLEERPAFHMIGNGVRPLAIHVDDDLPREWQLNRFKEEKWAFEAAGNVFMYVTDKGSLRPRGVVHWPDMPESPPRPVAKLARLQYAGHWNPEPLALERFARMMLARTGKTVEVVNAVEIGWLSGAWSSTSESGLGRIACLTGTGALRLSAKEKQELKDFVTKGGVLVVDAAGGAKRFTISAEERIEEIFADAARAGPKDAAAQREGPALVRLARTDPIFRIPGMEIQSVEYRRVTRKRLEKKNEPNLCAVVIAGRPAVLFSREDLTAGLVGCEAYGCDGYRPESAFEILRNIVLCAADSAGKE